MKNGFGKDDVAAIFTMACILAFSITLAVSTRYGFGLHTWQMTPEDQAMYIKYMVMTWPPYVLAVCGYKAILLLLYLRIFEARSVYRWVCIGGLVVVGIATVSNLMAQMLVCQPLRKYWDKEAPGHCRNPIPAIIAHNTLCVFADIYIALLPLPIIWQLQMKKQNKIHLTLIFSIGILTFICALIRSIYCIIEQDSYDRFGMGAHTYIWSNIEVNVGLICGCIPTLKPIFAKFKGEKSWGSGQRVSRNLSGETMVDHKITDGKSPSVLTVQSV